MLQRSCSLYRIFSSKRVPHIMPVVLSSWRWACWPRISPRRRRRREQSSSTPSASVSSPSWRGSRLLLLTSTVRSRRPPTESTGSVCIGPWTFSTRSSKDLWRTPSPSLRLKNSTRKMKQHSLTGGPHNILLLLATLTRSRQQPEQPPLYLVPIHAAVRR